MFDFVGLLRLVSGMCVKWWLGVVVGVVLNQDCVFGHINFGLRLLSIWKLDLASLPFVRR